MGALRIQDLLKSAGIAQLVERLLAMQKVAGSIPVTRSILLLTVPERWN